MFDLCTLLSIAAFVYVTYYIFAKELHPLPINAVYSQRGKWFWPKYLLIRLQLWRRAQKKHASGDVGYGVKSKANVADMETPQPLSSHPKAIDAVYFNGSNHDGYYLVCSAARRPENVIQGVVQLRVPEFGTLVLPMHPDSTMQARNADSYSTTSGLHIKMVTPMKRWHINFDGNMRLLHDGQAPSEVDVKLNIVWTSTTDYFDYDSDMDQHAVAKAIALEPWSKEFFERLQESHQTHYEQYGKFECKLTVTAGRQTGELWKEDEFELIGLRDHSYGKYREWKHFHRYALQMFHLDDNGSCFQVGIVSMPGVTMSRLELGYVLMRDGSKVAVSDCSLNLHEVGEDGVPPKVFEFSFVAGGEKYRVECEEVESLVFYIGPEWEARIHERYCRFVVNGHRKGVGISEFDYRNYQGKPKTVSSA